MKKIAIITGASSGMGAQFAKTTTQHFDLDELWIIARREDKLQELSKQITDVKVKILPLDLTANESIQHVSQQLAEEPTQVVLLVNAAGFGGFQAISDIPINTADNMLILNCKALMDMCYICLPYMQKGSHILNIASVAAFQPVPYIAEYAATKAFVLSFSRALWKELKNTGVSVTALCPYWTKTEFFDVANTKTNKDRIHYFNAMYESKDVVNRAWRDLLRGRDISTYGFIARTQILIVKLLPHRLIMKIWCHQQKIK